MENFKIELPTMSKIQKHKFTKLDDSMKLRYLASFKAKKDYFGLKLGESIKNRDFFDMPIKKDLPKIYSKGEFSKIIDKFYRTSEKKIPTISKRGFIGVEIECYLPQDAFDRDYVDCENDDCSEYGECTCDDLEYTYLDSVRRKVNSLKIKGIQIVEDGSLTNDQYDEDSGNSYFGLEFKCLTNVDDFSNLAKLIKWLNDKGAMVNSDCGLHIHMDSRHLKSDQSKKLTALQFEHALPFLCKMVSKDRLTSTYCQPRVDFSERYSAINMTALEKHGTIENRLHSGSLNFEKITNWIKLNYAILNCRHLRKIQPKTLKDFFNVIGLDDTTKQYQLKRIYKFNKDYVLTEFPLFDNSLNDDSNDSTNEDNENVA